jgi:two-component system, cell cycle sensor histidine kinase DivJ
MDWVDHWLAGLVHQSGRSDPTECFRHERFIVSRTVSTLAALAAIPPYLIGRGAPTALEILSLAVFLAPLAAVVLASRTGRLDGAQAIVSAALMLFAAGASATFGGTSTLAILALAFVPLEALLSGSRRATAVAALLGLFGIPFVLIFEANGLGGGGPTALATVFAVGFAVALGHAVGQAVGDFRLRAHLQTALRSGEARESAAFQAIDDLVTWHDCNGSVVKANGGGARLLGTVPMQLKGRGFFCRIHVADRPAYLKAISDAASATEPVVVQFRMRAGDGVDPLLHRNPALARIGSRGAQDLVWVEMRAHRLRAPGEDGAVVVAATRSIAEHMQRAEELETLHRAANRAGEERAQLLATASQELRTPLDAIIGYAAMLKAKGGSGPMAKEYAEIIHFSGQHMLGVVSTLLDLSAVEAGGRDLDLESLDVAELVQDCCRSMTSSADRAGVAIAHHVSRNVPELFADRQACEQILLHLLSSAVKFTPRGGLVTVQAKREGERIAFTVRETGIGAPGVEPLQVGDRFRRSSAGRPRPEKSDGLGLSVVRSLVGLHQGRISIASTPGDGMSVTVSLPVEAGRTRRATPPMDSIVPPPVEGALALKTG